MGKKQRSKKFEREEKSKVKLRKKQLLPKGQNVTDTTFKVRKIVIREQLKVPSAEEPLSSRKLNVKELRSRLQHHNSSMRQDAIHGLAELVANFSSEILDGVHLPQVIENVTRLSLESESAVRREAVKLLGSIFKKVDEVHIVPLLDVLLSYMCCAMTHINHAIQEDSLLLLDAVLDSYPKLMARHVHTVLPKFLDMISRLRSDSKPGRMLIVNLGSRLTSVRWRIQTLLFRQHSASNFRQHLMSSFPYSVNKSPSSDKRERREHRRNIQLLTKCGVAASLDVDCVQQNMALCYLSCCLLQPVDAQVSEMVLQYVTRCLESHTVDDAELLPVLRELLLGEAKMWSGVPDLLSVIVSVIGRRAKLIHVLCELLSRSEISYWQRSTSFQNWIGLLPDELCKQHVPYKVIQAVHQLLSQKNTLLCEQLSHKIHKIIDNLAYVTITGTDNAIEAKKYLGDSVYWIMNHDRRMASIIQKHIQNDKLDKELKIHITQILELEN